MQLEFRLHAGARLGRGARRNVLRPGSGCLDGWSAFGAEERAALGDGPPDGVDDEGGRVERGSADGRLIYGVFLADAVHLAP